MTMAHLHPPELSKPQRASQAVKPPESLPAMRLGVIFKLAFPIGGLVIAAGLTLLPLWRNVIAYRTAEGLLVAGIASIILGISGTFYLEGKEEQRRRQEVSAILGRETSGSYFEKLADVNVENLSAYYVTVKAHANKSFLASLSVSCAGFILIGIGVYFSLKDSSTNPVSTLSAVSGVATEFISAVFFYLYNRTVRQMKDYHDSLIEAQNILLSFKLVEDTADPKDKARMTTVMLEYLVGKRSASEKPGVGLSSQDMPPARAEDKKLTATT